MKNAVFGLLIVLMSSLAQASSLAPCEPTQRMQPNHLSCSDENYLYLVTTETYQVPGDAYCPGGRDAVIKMATVSMKNKETLKVLSKIQILDGAFSYSFGDSSDPGFFKSERHALSLNNCISPIHGGVSVGN